MDRIQEKLNSFEKTVNKEVMEEKAELEEEIKKETADRLEEIRKKYQKAADEKFNINLRQIEKEVNGEIWADNTDAQKRILDKTNQIINDIMNAVMAGINDFMNSDGYEGYLISTIKKALTQLGGGEVVRTTNPAVYLTSKDKERFADALVQEFQDKIDIQINYEIIGGCIVESEDGMIVDNSIRNKIGEQKDLLMYNVRPRSIAL